MFKFLDVNERKKKEENGKMTMIERKKYQKEKGKNAQNVRNWKKIGAAFYFVRLNFNLFFLNVQILN